MNLPFFQTIAFLHILYKKHFGVDRVDQLDRANRNKALDGPPWMIEGGLTGPRETDSLLFAIDFG